ncbi:MOSC domain-containing protein [Alsobacter sp. KACC 23698]|uniref:MOSC domain-containing protein n=1 Tax=Alsobacter sp. KACC 23698 TaxID=3149229 RepID=A0AAU7JDC6_9HYPH
MGSGSQHFGPALGEARIAALHRYPVKGLSPESLDAVQVTPGDPFPHDRRYAIENGPSGFDARSPAHLPKIAFLMLMRNEALARLRTRFDPETTTLTIHDGADMAAAGDLSRPEGRAAIEDFFARFSAKDLRGTPRVLEAPAFSFSDTPRRVVSIINRASVQDLEARLGRPVDPLRFRGNVLAEGWPAWSELDLVGAELRSTAGVRLTVVKRIQRCAATNVDPTTAERDMNIPATLQRAFDHADCGVYAEVTGGGTLALGDTLALG